MNHAHILNKLAAAELVETMEWEVAHATLWAMLRSRGAPADVPKRTIPPLLKRWRCLFDDSEASQATKDVGWVALATLLHKYGLADKKITARAEVAISRLNRNAVLSDAFERQSRAMVAFLRGRPQPLSRRPARRKSVTFLRPGDVFSIRCCDHFHTAYVLSISGTQYPVIEFYEGVFTSPPQGSELIDRPAAGGGRFGVDGLRRLPDPSGQVRQIVGRSIAAPIAKPRLPGEGLYSLTDIIQLQTDLRNAFDC